MRSCYFIGMERTGLGWLSQELAKSSRLHVTVEKEPQVSSAVRIARYPEEITEHYSNIVDAYKQGRALVARRADNIHIDTNPSLVWIAHLLADKIPDIGFVAIKRRVYAVVSSMMKQEGTEEDRMSLTTGTYRLPSRLDGLTAAIWDYYPHLPVESRCALVWLAHTRKLDALQEDLGDKLLVLQYEWLVLKPEQEFGRLWEFLGMDSQEIEVYPAPVDKWMNHLTPEQVGNIWNVVSDEFYTTEIDRLIREDRERGW